MNGEHPNTPADRTEEQCACTTHCRHALGDLVSGECRGLKGTRTSNSRMAYCKCAFTDPDGTFVPGEACPIHPGVVPQRVAGEPETAETAARQPDVSAASPATRSRRQIDGGALSSVDCYDAGLLGDGGGGNVEWWHDYIRAELCRAHEFYQAQISAHEEMALRRDTMTDEQIKYMVNRFLGWKLPENFQPDAGISFKAWYNEHTSHPMVHQPSGTNLFDAMQTEEMVRYMIEGMPL